MGLNINWINRNEKETRIAQEDTKRHESDNKTEVQKELIGILEKVLDGAIDIIKILINSSKN